MYSNDKEFVKNKEWIKQAIAYSRLSVEDEVKRTEVKKDTKFALGNMYAIRDWIPMRSDMAVKVNLTDIDENKNSYSVEKKKKKVENSFHQYTIFEVERNE